MMIAGGTAHCTLDQQACARAQGECPVCVPHVAPWDAILYVSLLRVVPWWFGLSMGWSGPAIAPVAWVGHNQQNR
eukprot:8357482-Prorocentrum_lima.AAC.1